MWERRRVQYKYTDIYIQQYRAAGNNQLTVALELVARNVADSRSLEPWRVVAVSADRGAIALLQPLGEPA